MTTRLRTVWDMYKVDAAAFHKATTVLHQAISAAEHAEPQFQRAPMGNSTNSTKAMLMGRLASALAPLNVPITKLTLRDVLIELEDQQITFLSCGQLLLNLSETLRRELESAKVLAIDSSREGYYEPSIPIFGKEVSQKFPSIAYDIDQSGKCYAFDVTTGSVFHSVRCLEAGVRAIARCLGIPDPIKGKDRNWGNVSKAIKDELDKRWPASSGRMSGDAHLFDEMYGALSGMQNPYRNATMHLETNYTAPEALHIMEVVKGLMQKIASRMDEQGLPLA